MTSIQTASDDQSADARSALQDQQSALLNSIFSNAINSIAASADFYWASCIKDLKNTSLNTRGLRAYRAHAQALCVATLQASYPVLEQLIGSENFAHLAQDLWQTQPPEQGDLARWGAALPAFLRSWPALQEMMRDHPYLSDVAQLEWALHRAATAPDSVLDTASFSLLTQRAPETVTLRLSAGCVLQTSAHPTAALLQLHRPQDAIYLPQAQAAVAAGLNSGKEFHALVWRRGWVPCVRPVSMAEAALLKTLQAEQSLASALDAALAIDIDFDFSTWLQTRIHSHEVGGLVIGAMVCA